MTFSEVKVVVDWIFSELGKFVDWLWTSAAWCGMLLIALPLLRKIIDIFKRLLN